MTQDKYNFNISEHDLDSNLLQDILSLPQSQDLREILEEHTILALILEGQHQFQRWTTQILKNPDECDCIVEWESQLKTWEKTLSLLLGPVNSHSGYEKIKQKQERQKKWNALIKQQIKSAWELYETLLDNVTKRLLQFSPQTELEQIEARSGIFSYYDDHQ